MSHELDPKVEHITASIERARDAGDDTKVTDLEARLERVKARMDPLFEWETPPLAESIKRTPQCEYRVRQDGRLALSYRGYRHVEHHVDSTAAIARANQLAKIAASVVTPLDWKPLFDYRYTAGIAAQGQSGREYVIWDMAMPVDDEKSVFLHVYRSGDEYPYAEGCRGVREAQSEAQSIEDQDLVRDAHFAAGVPEEADYRS